MRKTKRNISGRTGCLLAAMFISIMGVNVYGNNAQVEQWGVFETAFQGPADGVKFAVEVIDTWNMTITPVDGVFEIKKRDNYIFADKDGRSVPLPGKPYIALRIRRIP